MTFHTKSRKSHFERYATRADEAHFRLFIQKKIKAGTSDTKLVPTILLCFVQLGSKAALFSCGTILVDQVFGGRLVDFLHSGTHKLGLVFRIGADGHVGLFDRGLQCTVGSSVLRGFGSVDFYSFFRRLNVRHFFHSFCVTIEKGQALIRFICLDILA